MGGSLKCGADHRGDMPKGSNVPGCGPKPRDQPCRCRDAHELGQWKVKKLNECDGVKGDGGEPSMESRVSFFRPEKSEQYKYVLGIIGIVPRLAGWLNSWPRWL